MRIIIKWPWLGSWFYLDLNNESKFTDHEKVMWISDTPDLPINLHRAVSIFKLQKGQTAFVCNGDAVAKFLFYYFKRFAIQLPNCPILLNQLEIKESKEEQGSYVIDETVLEPPPPTPQRSYLPIQEATYLAQFTWYNAKIHFLVIESFARHKVSTRCVLPPQVVNHYVRQKLLVASQLIDLYNCRIEKRGDVISKLFINKLQMSSKVTWRDYLTFCQDISKQFQKITSHKFSFLKRNLNPDKLKLYHCLLTLFPEFAIQEQLNFVDIKLQSIQEHILDYVGYQTCAEQLTSFINIKR